MNRPARCRCPSLSAKVPRTQRPKRVTHAGRPYLCRVFPARKHSNLFQYALKDMISTTLQSLAIGLTLLLGQASGQFSSAADAFMNAAASTAEKAEPEAQAAMMKPQEDAFAMTTEDQMLLDSFFESPKQADGELSDMAS